MLIEIHAKTLKLKFQRRDNNNREIRNKELKYYVQRNNDMNMIENFS